MTSKNFVADLVEAFENGKLSRRELVGRLTAAVVGSSLIADAPMEQAQAQDDGYPANKAVAGVDEAVLQNLADWKFEMLSRLVNARFTAAGALAKSLVTGDVHYEWLFDGYDGAAGFWEGSNATSPKMKEALEKKLDDDVPDPPAPQGSHQLSDVYNAFSHGRKSESLDNANIIYYMIKEKIRGAAEHEVEHGVNEFGAYMQRDSGTDSAPRNLGYYLRTDRTLPPDFFANKAAEYLGGRVTTLSSHGDY